MQTEQSAGPTLRFAGPAHHPGQPEFDAAQRQAIDAACLPGATLVVGAPGSGKTACLVEAAARRAVGGDLSRVLCLAQSRSGAQRLRARLVERVGRSQVGLKITTLFGFARSLVTSHQDDPSVEWRTLTAPEQELQLRELLSGWGAEAWPTDVREAIGTRQFARELRDVLARSRQLGLDPDDLAAIGRAAGRDDWRVAGEFAHEYLDVLDARGVLDYPELVHRARLLLLDDRVARRVSDEVSVVHVDDFAELDLAQVGLLADLRRLGVDVVAWADPWTRVDTFRGADARAVTDFAERFSVPGSVARRVELAANHRSCPAIADAVKRLGARLPVEGGVRYAATADEGSGDDGWPVEAVTFDSAHAQYEQVASRLRRWRSAGVRWAHMAVLTRAGRAGLGRVARALMAAGIPVEVDGDDLALADEVAVRVLLRGAESAMTLARGEKLSPSVVPTLLTSPLGGLDAVEIRSLSRAVLAMERDDAPRPSTELMALALSDPAGFDGVDHPASERAGHLAGLLARAAKQICQDASVEEVLWTLWDGTSWPQRLRAQALSGDAESSRAHRYLDAVIALFDVAARHPERRGEAGLGVFVEELSGQQIAADTRRESDIAGRGVRVTTAHRTRGQEWSCVVLVDVQEGLWPTLRRRGTILDPDRLTPEGLAEPESVASIVAEERRLFILALSRARERVMVCATAGDEVGSAGPSRFLTEIGVHVDHVSGYPRRRLTRAGLVGELRRVLADSASPGLKRAAAAQLVRLAGVRDGRGRPLLPEADPAHWWAMSDYTPLEDDRQTAHPDTAPDTEIVVTPSQVETLLTCPRRWFLKHRARVAEPASDLSAFGTLIHAAAQYLEGPDPDIDALESDIDAAWKTLPFAASWLSEHERRTATEILRRYLAWRALRSGQTLLGTEVPVDVAVEVDGARVRLRGQVDRLEQDPDGGLRIIDLKTGKRAPTRAAVASHDQLGLYQLAAALGAFDSLAGGRRHVNGAELVYLRVPERKKSDLPKTLAQASLQAKPHLDDDSPPSGGYESWVMQRLGEAVAIIRSGEFVAKPGDGCRTCPFASGCPAVHESEV